MRRIRPLSLPQVPNARLEILLPASLGNIHLCCLLLSFQVAEAGSAITALHRLNVKFHIVGRIARQNTK